MIDFNEVIIKYMPEITDDQLWDFYVKNDICEVGYGKETAVKPLKFNPYLVGAFFKDNLVGIIRATFDGLSANIVEFCLDCELQGDNLKYNNGSLIECDKYDIAKLMGDMLIKELRKLGNTFVSANIVEGVEENIYVSIGLKLNVGHLQFYKDERPYV